MSRIKLLLPSNFEFSTIIKVRVSDLNYGNHLSNDVYLAFLQEARMQYLAVLGYSEKDLSGVSVIMGDSAIVYQSECFYGDELQIAASISDFGNCSFDFYYKITKINDNHKPVAEAKTGMVCFDYVIRKTIAIPQSFIEKVKQWQINSGKIQK